MRINFLNEESDCVLNLPTCMFARTSTGMLFLFLTPAEAEADPTVDLHIFCSSSLASSSRSSLVESTTKMMPSVHLQNSLS